jgi:hypothetical protein
MSRIASLAGLALLVASTLGAQERTRSIGLGTSISPGALVIPGEEDVLLFQAGFNSILVPIRFSKVTIEPEISVMRARSEETVQTGSNTFGTATSSITNTRFGVGILWHLARRENLEPYIGPRFGTIRSRSKSKSPFSTSQEQSSKSTDRFLAAVGGAQYFFSPHFSLGAEAQLLYTKIGTEERSGTTSPQQEGNQSTLGTTGLAILRFYY